MTTAVKKFLLIFVFALCLINSAVIELSQPNENSADGIANQGPNQNANSNAFNTNGKKYGLSMTWEEYKAEFSKRFDSPQEEAFRRATFEQKKKNIETDDCDACGVNKFADWTESQFKALLGTFSQGGDKSSVKNINNVDATVGALTAVPSSFNWQTYGAVTPPKNQGSCGSCWAFSATGFLESELIRRGTADKTLDLAEQFMTRCDTASFGCNGGYPFAAADFGLKKGLPFQSSYPYRYDFNYTDICTAPIIGRTFTDVPATVNKYSSSTKAADSTIITYLLQRPLMLGVNANDWGSYAPSIKKILTCKKSNSAGGINHAVLLVGYTSSYWIVKNSWGTNWGIGGYIYVTRSRSYNCGIGTYYGWLSNVLSATV